VDLTKAAAYSEQTPCDLWQAQEEIPIQRGHCIEDLSVLAVAPWVCDGCQAERADSERPRLSEI